MKFLESKKYKIPIAIYCRLKKKYVPCLDCSSTGHHQESFFYSYNSILFKELFLHKIQDLPYQDNLIYLLLSLGFESFTLSTKVKNLSESQYQRLLLIKFLSFEGTGSLFLFDEPSIGLSLEEKKTVIQLLQKLIHQKNTVILIDHDPFFQAGVLFLLERLANKEETGRKNYAYLYDRVAAKFHQIGLLQKYGTQVDLTKDSVKLKPYEGNIGDIEKHREAVDLEPLSDYLEKIKRIFQVS